MTVSRPPIWFRVAVALLILWGLAGIFAFHSSLSATARAQMTAYDRHLYEDQPVWFMPVYGLAVWSGLVGSVLLALRRRLARGAYVASLVAVVVMFGWMFLATDIVAVKGIATATGFPIVIALIALAQIALATHAIRRGWIG